MRIGIGAYRGYRQNRLGGQCAQFAYYSLLALAPLLILIVASLCGCHQHRESTGGENPSNAARTHIVPDRKLSATEAHTLLRTSYESLLRFKDSPDFHATGFHPDGKYVTHFRHGMTPEEMAEKMKAFIR